MTPQNEAHMGEDEKLFRKWVQDTGEHRPIHSLDSWGGIWEGFEFAYSSQQEKIDKLQKDSFTENSRRQEHINKALKEENKSLRSDLTQQRFNNSHNLSIDQEVANKIEKLEKENRELKVKAQMNIHNSAFNGAIEENKSLNEMVKSLRSDLYWATNLISLGSLEYSNHNDCHNKEIRERHNLDKSGEI